MSSQILITSPVNPSIKRFKALSTRRRRRYRDGLFTAEGIRTVQTLLENGSIPEEILLGEEISPALIDNLLKLTDASNVRFTYAANSVLREIADTVSPQFVCAVFEMNRKPLPVDSNFVLVVDGVQDPGNFGSIIRTAVAAGIDAVVTMPGSVDLYSPKVVRAAAGLVESLPVSAAKSLDEVIEKCFKVQPQIVFADAAAEISYTSVDWTKSTILIVGNEASGPRNIRVDSADIRASIPMSTTAESVNVTAATAVLLFEANRQRSAKQI